jgi:hypothetical protein
MLDENMGKVIKGEKNNEMKKEKEKKVFLYILKILC